MWPSILLIFLNLRRISAGTSFFMISYLQGKVAQVDPAHIVMDIHGVGYDVRISLNTFSQVKDVQECKLYTHLHIKEDAHTLYGFSDKAEKAIFLHLISITGVGPGTALMITSSMSVEDVRHAILQENVKAFEQVKGIGGKTAKRIILELKDKMSKEGHEMPLSASAVGTSNTMRSEALAALLTLGIPRAAAEKSLDAVLQQNGQNMKLEELIKMALKRA
jgi:Holliday junction DNA helicase RuvA